MAENHVLRAMVVAIINRRIDRHLRLVSDRAKIDAFCAISGQTTTGGIIGSETLITCQLVDTLRNIAMIVSLLM